VTTDRPPVSDWAGQQTYEIRCDWGPPTVPMLTGGVCVIVDVLRFSTAVEAATARGVAVYPARWRDEGAAALAAATGAVLADGRDPAGPSLSPASLRALAQGSAVVLPSPNGATCALLAAGVGAQVVAGCLRNAAAVAAWVDRAAGPVTVLACGERWPDGSLRPALEDLLGAGAILAALPGERSPEAQAAVAAFRDAEPRLAQVLARCASGRELTVTGRGADVDHAGQLNVSTTVPVLGHGAFRAVSLGPGRSPGTVLAAGQSG
jgi:2-phosphosulfolactate phosphatase